MKHLILLTVITSMLACAETSPIKSLQGTYMATTEEIARFADLESSQGSGLPSAIVEQVIQNAVYEVSIDGDSVKGLFFLGGESNIINRGLSVVSDTVFVLDENTPSSLYFLIKDGTIISGDKRLNREMTLTQLDQQGLSEDVLAGIAAEEQRLQEEREFQESLGVWQKGVLVDNFGDEVEGDFIYVIVPGAKTTSRRLDAELVYARASINEGTFFVQLFDESLEYVESLPSGSGQATLKKESGEVVRTNILFSENLAMETGKVISKHLLNDDTQIKIRIDLSDT